MNLVFKNYLNKKNKSSYGEIFGDLLLEKIKTDEPVLHQFITGDGYVKDLSVDQIYVCYEFVKAIKNTVITNDTKQQIKIISVLKKLIDKSETTKIDSWLKGYYSDDQY